MKYFHYIRKPDSVLRAVLFLLLALMCVGETRYATPLRAEVFPIRRQESKEHQDKIVSNPEPTGHEPEQFSAERSISEATDESIDQEPRQLTWAHVFQLLIVATLIVWGYSLVMSGKHGQGWLVLMAIGGVLGYFLRMLKSLFREVSSSNEVRDWDDE